MKVSVNNFRGIENAEIELGEITIIGGDNGAGKSSIAQAISAAITGENPIRDLKKSDLVNLVKIGAETATAEISDESGNTIMSYPDGKGFTKGNPPRSSAYAVGIISPLDMNKKDAAERWISILNAEPTLEDLQKALAENKHSGMHIDEVLQLVKTRGWDGADEQIKKDGTKFKGRWEKITGENYGTKKAENWKPVNFDITYLKPDLEKKVAETKSAYEESLKFTAIADEQKKKLQEQAKDFEKLKSEVKNGENEEAELLKSKNNAEKALENAKNSAKTLKCPCCGKYLLLQNGILVEDSGIKPKIDEFDEDFANALKAYSDIQKVNANLRAKLFIAEDAAKKLLTISDNNVKSKEQAESEYEEAKRKLTAFDAFHEAHAENLEVMWRIEVARILTPDGLRKSKSEESIANFNVELAQISNLANWGKVEIDFDFTAKYDERPFVLLSESEQYRVKATIQIAIAMRDGSNLLIFDRVDILTKDGRNGLFHACNFSGIKSVMLMSVSDTKEIPQTQYSYFVEKGVLQKIGD